VLVSSHFRGLTYNFSLSNTRALPDEHAAEREGRTLNTFIVESALLSADQSLQAHERMVLSGHDAEALFAALTSPPEPGTARTEAMREYQERVTSR
jgi:uncharacterized protein (DUF1778 family)